MFSIVDMQIGYYPEGGVLVKKILNDQYTSFHLGSELILKSVPFNILVAGLAFYLLYKSRVFNGEIYHE